MSTDDARGEAESIGLGNLAVDDCLLAIVARNDDAGNYAVFIVVAGQCRHVVEGVGGSYARGGVEFSPFVFVRTSERSSRDSKIGCGAS